MILVVTVCDWRMNMFQGGSGDKPGLSRKLRHGAPSQW